MSCSGIWGLRQALRSIIASPAELEVFSAMVAAFKKQAPHWDGLPITPETSVKMMRELIEKCSPADTGAFISHFGNKQWL